MMRRTLTRFKDRTDDSAGAARIYSFAFGDSEADNGSQVMAGQLELCSAVALHKMHAAAGFGLPAAFNLTKTADITDGRNVRNPIRPAEILTGANGPALDSISRRSAKTHKPDDVEFVAAKIGELTDRIMLPLFDRLRPYASHNQATRQLLEALNDPTALADPVQAKCRSLLFDGTGNRHVFEEHIGRLKENIAEVKAQGQTVPAHLTQQLTYCDSVSRALLDREEAVKLNRSYILFNIDVPNFGAREKATVEADVKELRARGRAIFDTLSTQAFQLGYLMAVLSHVEILLPAAATYDDRLATTDFVSTLYLAGLNSFFAVPAARHRTLSGYVSEPRARAFEASQSGFRGLLAATNVRELNEKQWEFFRYMILEIVHASQTINRCVWRSCSAPAHTSLVARFRASLPAVADDIETLRSRLFEAAVRTAQGTPDFRREVDMLGMQAKANGKTDDEVKLLIDAAVAAKRAETIEISKAHLKASLGRLEFSVQIQRRLAPSATVTATGEGESPDAEPTVEQTDLEVAVAADHLQHPSEDDDKVE